MRSRFLSLAVVSAALLSLGASSCGCRDNGVVVNPPTPPAPGPVDPPQPKPVYDTIPLAKFDAVTVGMTEAQAVEAAGAAKVRAPHVGGGNLVLGYYVDSPGPVPSKGVHYAEVFFGEDGKVSSKTTWN